MSSSLRASEKNSKVRSIGADTQRSRVTKCMLIGTRSGTRSSDPRHDHHGVGGRVHDVVADERVRRAGVVAEAAPQLRLGTDARRRRDRELTRRAQHRPLSEHLEAVADEAAILADGRAARAAELDVGLAAIAWVGSNFEAHT
jgi:hypothetical protein